MRLAAALALLLGAAALLAYLDFMGRGPFAGPTARHLRAMKDRRGAPTSVEAVTMADIAALPHRTPLSSYAAIEGRGVMAEGYVQRMMRALDDDVHLELAPAPRAPGGPDTTYISAEITPGWRAGSKRWSYGALEVAFRPNHGGVTAWDGGPRRMRVSGWLLYDYQYDAPPTPVQERTVAPRISGWEIHPVTRVELWDEDLGRFVELAR